MRQPCIDVIKTGAPKAVLVFEKFHIVQHLTQAVDQVCRDVSREKGKSHQELMAKSRHIRLKNPWNLTDKQQIRLSEPGHLNLKIKRAYLLKEALHEFWEYTRPGWAKRYLDRWFWWATHSRLEPIGSWPGCGGAIRRT
jgi:transposase